MLFDTIKEIRAELERARSKFPANKQLLHAFVEEAGEVTKAFLDMQQKGGSPDDIRKELIQAACMAVRLLEEGDPEFPGYVPKYVLTRDEGNGVVLVGDVDQWLGGGRWPPKMPPPYGVEIPVPLTTIGPEGPPQSAYDLDKFYTKPDPWGYQANVADEDRKRRILNALEAWVGWVDTVYDIACGEGWITKDFQARRIWGWDISPKARGRFPPQVFPFSPSNADYPGCMDLVVCTGALYKSYDWEKLLYFIKHYAKRYVLTCHIKDREVPEVMTIGTEIYSEEFDYDRGDEKFVQKLRIFEVER